MYSGTCSCVSIFSGHFRHFVSLYLPLKLFFTSNILVLALNIIDASWRVNSFMYLGRSPTFHLVFCFNILEIIILSLIWK